MRGKRNEIRQGFASEPPPCFLSGLLLPADPTRPSYQPRHYSILASPNFVCIFPSKKVENSFRSSHVNLQYQEHERASRQQQRRVARQAQQLPTCQRAGLGKGPTGGWSAANAAGGTKRARRQLLLCSLVLQQEFGLRNLYAGNTIPTSPR